MAVKSREKWAAARISAFSPTDSDELDTASITSGSITSRAINAEIDTESGYSSVNEKKKTKFSMKRDLCSAITDSRKVITAYQIPSADEQCQQGQAGQPVTTPLSQANSAEHRSQAVTGRPAQTGGQGQTRPPVSANV